MTITTKAKEMIKASLRLRQLLAVDLDRHVTAIDRWLEADESEQRDYLLTSPIAVKRISEETGLTEQEILTDSTPVQK